MPSSKNASPPAIDSSLRQSSAVFSRLTMLLKWPNTISPITPSASSWRSLIGERLVMIVLADEHDALRAIARVAHRLVIAHRQVRRLLDQHVLAGGQRLQRQVEMKPRRHRDDDGIDVRIVDGVGVVRIAARAAILTAERRRLGLVAAGVAADDFASETAAGSGCARA